MAEIVEHPDGVYLNMTEEAYYADYALGYTALLILHSSPPDWWWESPFNQLVPPKRKGDDDDETKAMRFGSAVHCALLEGMDVFRTIYGAVPDKFTHPKALDTADDLKAALREIGEKVSGNKDELIERLLAKQPDAQILSELQRAWMANGKKPLTRVEVNKINLMERVLMGPEGKKTSLYKAFTGGLSEVSVFWTDENGIRQRARFDKLKPNTTIDLKTFSNWKSRDFGKAMLRDAVLKGYHVQWAHYHEARVQLRRLVAEGKVFAPQPKNPELKAKIDADIALLHEIAKAETWKWVWVFYKTDGAPRAKGVILERLKHARVFGEGAGKREEALANFLTFRNHFGLGLDEPMWMDTEQLWTPSEEDFPTYAMVAD